MTDRLMKAVEQEDQFRLLFDTVPDLMFVQDLSGRFTRVNRAFENLTGYSREQAVDMTLRDLVAPEDRERIDQMMGELIGGGAPRMAEMRLQTASGERVIVELYIRLTFVNGLPTGMQGFARDVSSHRRDVFARALAESQLLEKTEQLARFSRDLTLLHRLSTTNYSQLDELFADYLRTGAEIFGVPFGCITQPVDGIYTVRALHPPGADYDGESQIGRFHAHLDCVVHHKQTVVDDSGSHVFIAAPISVNEQLYGAICFWSRRENIDRVHPQGREMIELMAKSIGIAINQRELTDLLEYQAKHDSLTGLPNRLALSERLNAAIQRARQSGRKLAVLFIDLDRFKQINDTLGHTVGDALLQQIARRLVTCLGDAGSVARMGGDEFTVILEDFATPEDAVRMGRKLLNAVRVPCRVEGYELFITASMGISYFPKDGEDAAALLCSADSAMYAAKYQGKNDIRCFTPEGAEGALEKFELETALRRVLQNEELTLFFQPQVELNGQLAAFEVLLGWEHPRWGRVPPSQFIPIAEESGLILPIGAWVLKQACRQAAAWQAQGLPSVPLAVNVSARQFSQADFIDTVRAALEEAGLEARLLHLEITESLLMSSEDAVERLKQLRQLGVKILIDDFGTGYSSLSYLRRLPVDALKIDRSFLDGVDPRPGALPLIQTICSLAHNMGLTVIAEGVEKEQHLSLVKEAGCDQAQGHLFGANLTAAEAEKLLNKRVVDSSITV